MMKDTTNATNNQQVIDENLQTANKNTFIPENEPLKRPDRRRLKRAAEKEAKKARTVSRSLGKARTDTTPPELSGDQLKILQESMENLKKGMIGNTWRTLEAGRSFKQNDKIKMITDDTLVVGVDVASNKHDMRAFTNRGIEVSDKALEFANSREGMMTVWFALL